jgi:uncharacterized protein
VFVRFSWDEWKRLRNIRKHGIDFYTAALVFDDPMHVTEQDREIDGERRWQTIGMVQGVLLLLVAYTVVDEDEEEIRIISAREAESHERRRYEEDF